MQREIKILTLFLGAFLLLYFMPTESALFIEAVISGLVLLSEYAREHVLTCLLPAFFIAGAISVFVKKDAVLKYLGGGARKVVSYSLASVSGGILAVCSCTVLPMFAGIRKRGAGLGPAVTFLFSGPAVNIAAIFLTFSVLGFNIGLARVLAAIPLAVLVGLSMHYIFREKVEKGNFFIEESDSSYKNSTVLVFMLSMVGILVIGGLKIGELYKYVLMAGLVAIIISVAANEFRKDTNREWLLETWSFTKILLPLLFVGVFIAGFIDPLISEELLTGLVGSNSITSNLVASLVGSLMYFSTLTEVPILKTFMDNGMHPGPALALLLAGPSLSLPNMLVIRKVLGNKKTLVYVILVVIYSTIGGLIFGSLF